MAYLRASLFYTLMAISTILYAPLTLLLFPFPYPFRYRVITLWTHFNLWSLQFFCRLKFEVEGTDNIPEGPAIIFCKHQSVWETLALQMIFPPQVWILKRELLRIPFFGWGLAMLDPIAIDRSSGRKAVAQLVEQGTQRLADGKWVTVFPEGTRTAPGTRRPYKIGGAVLAEKTAVPVVPVAHNAGVFWPRNSFVKRPGTIRLVIGPPIDTAGKSAAEIRDAVEDWIETTVATLIPD